MFGKDFITPRGAKFWVWCAFVMSVLVSAATALLTWHRALGLSAWTYLDVALTIALGFGVLRRNLACSIGLFVLHLLSRALMVYQHHRLPSFDALMIAGVYAMAAWSIFLYPNVEDSRPPDVGTAIPGAPRERKNEKAV